MLDNSHWQIPEHTYETLKRYVEQGIPTGGFLYAVLINDLFGAICRADSQNTEKFVAVCGFVYNETPVIAWGTPEKVQAWIEHFRVVETNGEDRRTA